MTDRIMLFLMGIPLSFIAGFDAHVFVKACQRRLHGQSGGETFDFIVINVIVLLIALVGLVTWTVFQ